MSGKKHTPEQTAKMKANSRKYAEACKSGEARRNAELYGECVPYCPSQLDIWAATQAIQQKWTRTDERARNCYPVERVGLERVPRPHDVILPVDPDWVEEDSK